VGRTTRSSSRPVPRAGRQRAPHGRRANRPTVRPADPRVRLSALVSSAWKRSGSVTASLAISSVHARCPIWCAIVHPSAGVGVAQAGSGRAETRASRSSLSAVRSARTGRRSATCRLSHRVAQLCDEGHGVDAAPWCT
jgi:hypothetical protein